MQKWELFKEVLKNTDTVDQYNAIITAVEAYLSASNNGKPLVSGSLPCEHVYLLKDADWMACSICGAVSPIGQ